MGFDVVKYIQQRKALPKANNDRQQGFDVKRYIKNQNSSSAVKSINDRLSTWFQNSKNFASNHDYRFSEGNNGYRSDSSAWLSTVTAQKENFDKEADSILSLVDEYSDYLQSNQVVEIKNALQQQRSVHEQIVSAAKTDNDFWSKFDSEESYNAYLRAKEDRQKKLDFDTSSEEKAIAALENIVSSYNSTRDVVNGKKYTYQQGLDYIAANDALQKELKRGGFSNVEALLADIEERKRYLNSAKYLQATKAADFAEYSQAGESKLSFGGLAGDDVYDYINNIDGLREKQDTQRLMSGGHTNAIYAQMTDEEIGIYNYFYAKEGKNKAEEYLDSLSDTLNARQSAMAHENITKIVNEHPFVGSAFLSALTVPASLLSGVEYISDAISAPFKGEMDTNTLSDFSSTVRGAVSEKASWEIGNWDAGKFLYNTGMSMADSLAAMGTLGNLGGTALGLSAAAQGTNDALQRGMSNGQAFWNGLTSGIFEGLFETVSIGQFNALKEVAPATIKDIAKNIGKSMLVNASEETLTEIANIAYDTLVNGEYADYTLAELESGDTWKQIALQIAEAGGSGALMGTVFGGAGSALGYGHSSAEGKILSEQYGYTAEALVSEALEIDPNNQYAITLKAKLDAGKTVSNAELYTLLQQNEKAIYEGDISSIRSAAENRLTELGEKENVLEIAEAIAKEVSGQKLTRAEQRTLNNSQYGQSVFNELNAENIRSGESSDEWTGKINTDRINVDEYSRLVRAAEMAQESDFAEAEELSSLPQKASLTEQAEPAEQSAKTVQESETSEVKTVEKSASAVVSQAEKATEDTSTEKAMDIESAEEEYVTLEAASKKYGAQSGAMVHTYTAGQDVERYDSAYQIAYNMGKSGVSLSYALKSEATAYLSENQRQLAYEAGRAASESEASLQDTENKQAANGKNERRKGTVKGEGVTIADLKKNFNDPQGKAYRVLSTIAEATGIDIVLYKTEIDKTSRFVGAQGKFKWSNNTIYIDVNAGLLRSSDVDNLANFTMLRTFSHEFTHFLEKWNPIRYNEFRKAVFDTLTERGENVDDLIETKQAQTEGMTYDEASREVVAEAMTDVLPDANFVQTLSEQHKTVFEKLLDQLKAFVADIKAYFESLAPNRSREANALKEQVGGTVRYIESIVTLFDNVAVEAVENYQATVATEEAATAESETSAAKIDSTEAINADENADFAENSQNEDVTTAETKDLTSKESTEQTGENFEGNGTKVPTESAVDEAKRELRKAVRMPIKGTNEEAILEGIKTGDLSMESITYSGSVPGFNEVQREHLVKKLIEGVYTDSETIKIDVPYDGKFEIDNTPGNVAKVLNKLKAKVNQEVLLDKTTLSILSDKGTILIVDLNGQKYMTNGNVLLPTVDSAVSYLKSEHGAKDGALPNGTVRTLNDAVHPLTKAPVETTFKGSATLVFEADEESLYFNKRMFSLIDGGQLFYAKFGESGIIKSVNPDGSIKGYLVGILIRDKSELTPPMPTNLRSFPKRAKSEKQASSTKGEKKTSAPNPSENTSAEAAVTEVTEVTEETKVTEKVKEIEAPKTVETTVKLEDFGEKIGGARKDEWGKRGLLSSDLSEMNDRERDKAVKKDNVWKRPDYRKLIEGGEKREILFARNEIRKSLNQNLTYSRSATAESKLELQKVFVNTVREIQAMTEKATTAAVIKAMGYDWLLQNGYLEVTNGYRSGYSYTDKWRKNPALHLSNYVQTIEHLARNFDKLGKLADQANFAVDAESKVPAGYSIREDDRDHTWYIAKGRYVVRYGLTSYDEALTILRNAAGATKKKTRFVPRQLQGVHRKGPDYRACKDVKGQDYLDTFGFKGGEFGNWMSEKDRRVSMNYGFDALKDLADALDIADGDISLSGNLSIAFGARGQGLSGAAAHYERERHVINLTKMNGAGNLAHEWFHALDDFAGGYGNNMSTDNLRVLPERTQAAMRSLLSTMQYRDATQEESDMAATKRYEQARRSVEYQVKTQFGWVEKVENGTLTDSDTRYFARKPTDADVKRYHELLDKLLSTGDASAVDELSALRKEVNGHVIAKENREAIGYRLWSLTPSETKTVQKMRLRSDYYNNSRLFGELHQKDGDYWDSTVEMAARAFACYITDKTNAQNDYLSAHSDSAVTFTADKSGNPVIVKAFPEGQERIDINHAFDALIEAMKEDGILHERGETVKPDMVQYQARDHHSEEKYSYEWFTQKSDMPITSVDDNIDQNRAEIVSLALKNAASVGYTNENGNAVVHVNDIDTNVIVPKRSLVHGLDRRTRTQAPVLVQIGNVLKNAIRVNELIPRAKEIKNAYVLIGAAQNQDGNLYIASFVVNKYSNEVSEIDVLYSANAKKESAALLPKITDKSATPTDSTISIAHLLDYVNSYFPDVLPESVLRHYGHEERPDGTIGKDALYQQRTNTLTDREVLAMAADEVKVDDLNAAEQDALRIFRERLDKLERLQVERAEQGSLYKEQQFGAKVDRAAAAETLNRMHVLDEQIHKASADVLAVEETTVLRQVLQKARKVVEAEERKHGQELLARWRDRRNNAAEIKKYRERIRKDVNELTNWILKPNNKDAIKHVPDVLKSAVIPFLSSIDFTSKKQLGGGDATAADKAFVKRLTDLKAALKQNTDAYGLYSGYTDLPPDFMDRLDTFIQTTNDLTKSGSGEYIINQMTSDELNELSKVVKTLKQYITNFNRFHVNAMYKHVYEAGNDTIKSLQQMKDDGGKAGKISNFVLWQQMRPAYAFERFGEGGKAVYDGLRRGQAQLAFNTKEIIDFSEKTYTEAEVKAWEKEVKQIKLGDDVIQMPVSAIMSFYELSKQPDSLRHMLGGGIRVATTKMGKQKISDVGHTITEVDVATIVGTLTDRQREVADALQQYMAEQGSKWGNYVSVARFGEELFGNPRYFPINSDGRHLQATADENPSAASLYALLNMSFTKSRNEYANNRIILYSIFDVFANHMASMAQYNAMALPVLDALKWFNYTQRSEPDENGQREIVTGVREQMARVYGVPEETKPGSGKQGYAETFVLNILKAFNGTEAQGSTYDAFGLNGLRRYNMAQVAYNFRVVVQQPLAVTRAALLIDGNSILKAMKNLPALKKNVAEMQKYSGIAAWKSLGFYDVNISRGLTELIKHKETTLDKISEFGMKGAEFADTMTWSSIWSACKEEVMKKQHLKPSDNGFYDAVTKLFEDVIYKTQVVDSVLTKNEYMRSKSVVARTLGSFMAEPTATASMVVNAYDKYHSDIQRGMSRNQAWQNNGKLIARTTCVYAISAVLLAAVQAIPDALRDDDEYEDFLEKWMEAFGGNLVDELMPFNKLPIMSEFYDLAKEVLSIFGVDTYGNPPQTVIMQWYDSLVKGVEIIYDKIAGEDTNYTWYGGVFKLLQTAAGISGLPMAAATREIVTAWNNTVGAMAPSLKVKSYDSGDKNEIKYAYMDGYLTAEEATDLLLENGFAETEDEAYWTLQEWDADGDYSRYGAVYDAVLNGGDFNAAMDEMLAHGYEEKTVLTSVKSQIGRWYYDDKSDVRITKQQAIDMLAKYTDMDSDEVAAQVNKWSCKVVTGIAYGDIGDEFIEGNITESRAIEMFMRYGGKTEKDAVEAYKEYCEPVGVDAGLYYEAKQKFNSFKSDLDENDKPIPGQEKRDKALAYIDSLDLSTKQKDALYYSFGYKKSTLYKAPWH